MVHDQRDLQPSQAVIAGKQCRAARDVGDVVEARAQQRAVQVKVWADDRQRRDLEPFDQLRLVALARAALEGQVARRVAAQERVEAPHEEQLHRQQRAHDVARLRQKRRTGSALRPRPVRAQKVPRREADESEHGQRRQAPLPLDERAVGEDRHHARVLGKKRKHIKGDGQHGKQNPKEEK